MQNSIIHFSLKKPDAKPLSEEDMLHSESTKLEYSSQTNESGKSDITVPSKDSYLTSLKSARDYPRVSIPKNLNWEMNYSLTYEGSL